MTSATLARSARSAQGRRVDVLRTLLTVLALVPYVLGWSAGVLVTGASWLWAATVVGWRDARRKGGDRQ